MFFPSHDIALSNGVRHFNPPFAAFRLQMDLESLSKIWNIGIEEDIPWGWDWDTRKEISSKNKCDKSLKDRILPTDEDLCRLRDISSRKSTIEIIEQLKSDNNDYDDVLLPKYITSEEELNSYINEESDFVLKTPWSSSGRGLSISSRSQRETLLKHGSATIKKMGGIIAEHWYLKTQDFAMLFYISSENVTFVGYSYFDNDEAGTYRKGSLMSNECIEKLLTDKVGIEILHKTRERLINVLNGIFADLMHKGWDIGYIGIDMLLFHTNNKGTTPHTKKDFTLQPNKFIPLQNNKELTSYSNEIKLHPCVEMNVRCTMGVVARKYFDNYCDPSSHGEFIITPAMTSEQLQSLDQKLTETYKESYHRLSEISADSMFMAYAIVL